MRGPQNLKIPMLRCDVYSVYNVKLMFSKKAAKFDEIFTVDLTTCSKCQIDGEDFINFCGFLENMNFKIHVENYFFKFFWPSHIIST